MIRNFCKMCGARLGPDADFCHNCGCRLDPVTPVPGSDSTGLNGMPSENTVAGAATASAVPDVPAAPDTLDTPAAPHTPVAPDTPAAPHTPVAPDTPAAPHTPAAPGLDAAAQNAQYRTLSFETCKSNAPLNMAQVDPDEIFHSFFGDAFPAPVSNAQTNAPANATATAPDAQTNAPANATATAPDAQTDAPATAAAPASNAQMNIPIANTAATTPGARTRTNAPADITALSPDLLTLTVDVMADRPVIEPLSVDGILKPQRTAESTCTAEPPRSAAPMPPAEATAAPGAANATVSDTAGTPGAASAPGTANIPDTQPALSAANTPGAASAPGTQPAPGAEYVPNTAAAPGAQPAPGAANAAPVPPYAPYMYGQPNAGAVPQPAPQYAPPAPHMPPPYPYAPGPWGYGAPQQPELISTGSYLGMFLIGMIPIVGFIYLIIQAVGNQWRPNRRNFARGFLAALAIAIAALQGLILLAGIIMSATGYYYY